MSINSSFSYCLKCEDDEPWRRAFSLYSKNKNHEKNGDAVFIEKETKKLNQMEIFWERFVTAVKQSCYTQLINKLSQGATCFEELSCFHFNSTFEINILCILLMSKFERKDGGNTSKTI